MKIPTELAEAITLEVIRIGRLVGLEIDSGRIYQLIDERGELQPGVSTITGFGGPFMSWAHSKVGGTQAANKLAALNRLRSRLLVDLIAEMKTQSQTGATGFGQLSEKEGEILTAASGQLDQIQTDAQLALVLNDIRDSLRRTMSYRQAPSGGSTTQPRRYNPATGTVE